MKYVGSKRRIAKHILPIMLKDRDNRAWVEPFVGGANIIEKVDGIRIGSDNNHYLISLLKSLQDGWLPPTNVTRDFYYEVKNNKDKYDSNLVGFLGFPCSFGSKWFGGYAKNSRGGNYSLEAYNSFLKQTPLLKDVQFRCCDYRELDIPKNSLIYCDPPYKNKIKYSTSKDFNHDIFWDWCRLKTNEGHKVFISEYEAPDDFDCLIEINTTCILNKNKPIDKIERLFKYRS